VRQSLIFVVLFAFAASMVASESLGDAAKREEARRKKNREQGVAAPVLALPDARPTPRSEAAASPTAAPAESGETRLATDPLKVDPTPSPSPAVATETAEELWRRRAAEARARVEMAEAAYERAQKAGMPRVAYEDDSGGTVREAIAEVQKRREEAKKDLDLARAAVIELEEQARRAGALPGWLR
jgi:hypothetical protein